MKIIERETLIFLIVVLPIAVLVAMVAPEYHDSILVGVILFAIISGIGWSFKRKKKRQK